MSMPEANTNQLWDSLWNDPSYRRNDVWGLEKERRGVRWKNIEKIADSKIGGIKGKRVVELGAGAGKVALLCALSGAEVTLVDYSEGALNRAKSLFDQFGMKAQYVQEDIFNLDEKKKRQYDLSMSFGLTEHFKGSQRFEANEAHLELLRSGGLSVIAVPNAYNMPYRLYKLITTTTGQWKYGEEYPYTRRELAGMMQEMGAQEFGFFGDALFDSLRFFRPFGSIRKGLGLPPAQGVATPLDGHLSYSLVCWAVRQ